MLTLSHKLNPFLINLKKIIKFKNNQDEIEIVYKKYDFLKEKEELLSIILMKNIL